MKANKDLCGVSLNAASGKWSAQVRIDGTLHHLGFFTDAALAATVITAYKIKLGILTSEGKKPTIHEALTYDNGNLRWAYKISKNQIGDVVGAVYERSGYVKLRYQGKHYAIHRLVWEILNGPIPFGMEIDHIDGNKQNNHIENLRLVSRLENARNLKLNAKNTTGVAGVRFTQGKYRVTIGAKYLGYFTTLEEAAKVRRNAELELGFHQHHGRK